MRAYVLLSVKPTTLYEGQLYVAYKTDKEYDFQMSREEVTKIATDGLRYKSKKSGTPFGGSSAMGTMSCYKCGLHKPRLLGTFKRLLNQSMFVCGDCSPAKA